MNYKFKYRAPDKPEPTLYRAVERVTDDLNWIYVECTMSDGQKGVFIQVDINFPKLAQDLVKLLNEKYQD